MGVAGATEVAGIAASAVRPPGRNPSHPRPVMAEAVTTPDITIVSVVAEKANAVFRFIVYHRTRAQTSTGCAKGKRSVKHDSSFCLRRLCCICVSKMLRHQPITPNPAPCLRRTDPQKYTNKLGKRSFRLMQIQSVRTTCNHHCGWFGTRLRPRCTIVHNRAGAKHLVLPIGTNRPPTIGP